MSPLQDRAARPEAPGDVHALAADLREVVGRLVRVVRAESDTLSPRLASALGHLNRNGAMTTSALAGRQQIRHQSMAATVKELETLGFVGRRADPADGRSTLIAISATGQARLDTERTQRLGWLADALRERLSDSERDRVADTLALLARLVDDAPPGS